MTLLALGPGQYNSSISATCASQNPAAPTHSVIVIPSVIQTSSVNIRLVSFAGRGSRNLGPLGRHAGGRLHPLAAIRPTMSTPSSSSVKAKSQPHTSGDKGMLRRMCPAQVVFPGRRVCLILTGSLIFCEAFSP